MFLLASNGGHFGDSSSTVCSYLQEGEKVADAWLHMATSSLQNVGDLLKRSIPLLPLRTAWVTA